jgi:hypothetical protein
MELYLGSRYVKMYKKINKGPVAYMDKLGKTDKIYMKHNIQIRD